MHAFTGCDDGMVEVLLNTDPQAVTRLNEADNGRGVEAFAPRPRRGLGFVQLLTTSMGGRCQGHIGVEGIRIKIAVQRPI